MSRERVLSVSIRDCEVQTFRSGGKGGQNQNKRAAFLRMVERPEFRYWLDVQLKNRKSDAELMREIDEELADPANVKVEYRVKGKWTEEEHEHG